MQPDRFTIKSQEALQAAQRLADERRNPQTMPEHLLAVLLEQEGGIVVPVLRKLGVDPATVRQANTQALKGIFPTGELKTYHSRTPSRDFLIFFVPGGATGTP